MNQNMIRQIKKMQEEMLQAQREIEQTVVETTAGGVVKVYMQGTKELIKVEYLDGFMPEGEEDLEMLSDMIVAACSQAYKEIEKITKQKLGKYESLMGGMGGLF